eukprot:gene12925-13026_t
MVQSALKGVVDQGHAAEKQSQAAISGHGDLMDVVSAVSKAELSLQTTIAVRDRVGIRMNEGEVGSLLRDTMMVTLKLGGPALAVALVVGVLMSLVQAVTQINEPTLAFVPKVAAICAALVLAGSFMLSALRDFTTTMFDRLIAELALLANLPGWAFASVLLLARIGCACMLLPGIGEMEVPMTVRAGFVVVFSALLLPILLPDMPPMPPNVGRLAGTVAAEAFNGLWLGWLSRMILLALPMAGQTIAGAIGMTNVLQPDAMLGAGASALQRLFGLAAPLLVMGSGLHVMPLAAITGSYRLVPAGQMLLAGDTVNAYVEALGQAFALGFQLAAPFLMAAILFHVSLGLLGRLVPSLQTYFVAAPGQILGGLLLLGVLGSLMVTVWMQAADTSVSDDADAEDKTEAASAKRVQQAREEGRAPLSQEVGGLAVLVFGVVLLGQIMPGLGRSTASTLSMFLSQAHRLTVSSAVTQALRSWAGIAIWFAVGAMVVGSLSVLIQTGFLIHLGALQPNLSKLNPLSGFGRVFGPHNAMQAGKSALKIAAMGAVGWNALSAVQPDFRLALFWNPLILADRTIQHITSIATSILGIQFAIAGFDLLRTRMRFNAEMRMTKQEQRDEARESDGDPHVKAKLKQIRQQRSRRRMLQAVPKAAVVVTNPTHYAVALAYENGSGGAPRVIAKGMDEVAARIREAAKAAGVPMVENPPLARALYPLPLDLEIPAEHFKAVAELIAYTQAMTAHPAPQALVTASIAHDLNNLLTAILAAADDIIARGAARTRSTDRATQDSAADARQIRDVALRGAILARQLLPGADGQAPPLPVPLNQLIHGIAPLLQRLLAPTSRLIIVPASRECWVLADPGGLERVLVNLVVNAAHAMPQGGTVTLRAEIHPAGHPSSDPVRKSRHARISVQDTGHGIPPEILPHIFKENFTTGQDRGGSGLGLAIARGIIRKAGGQIWALSPSGQGATIHLALPLIDPPAPPAPPSRPTSTHRGTILLADDEEPVRHLTARALLRAGWHVIEAESGQAAIESLQRYTDSGENISALVSDIVMPGMSGTDLAQAVRNRSGNPRLPVILISGYAKTQLKGGPACPKACYLTKPYRLADLVAALEQAMQSVE